MTKPAFMIPRLDSKSEPRLRRAIEEIKRQLGTGGISYGLFADRPDPGRSGQLYLATNSPFIYLDNGTEWLALHPRTFTPVTGSWATKLTMTPLNFSTGVQTPSASQGGDDTYLYDPANAILRLRCLVKVVPALPYSITVSVLPNTGFASSAFFLFWTDHTGVDGAIANAAAKFHCFISQHDAAANALYSFKFTGMDNPSAGVSYKAANLVRGSPFFMRIVEDASNRECWFSNDGINFDKFHTIGRTDFITATRYGIGWYSQSATDPAGFNWLSHEVA